MLTCSVILNCINERQKISRTTSVVITSDSVKSWLAIVAHIFQIGVQRKLMLLGQVRYIDAVPDSWGD